MKALLAAPVLVLIAALLAPPPASGADAEGDSAAIPVEAYEALSWRHVGPWQGGRVTTVAGVQSEPHRFYMGATGGGVWRSDNAGRSWRNLSDGFFGTTTIGAIAVAPSDPNVIYAGTGESPIRGVTTSHGDGVYRSTDGGETWTHLGLEATRQISEIVVHPSDPDVAWLAAQGNPWGPNVERGVYRTDDGGLSWEPVLQVSEDAGCVSLAIDPGNPRVLYAAFWDHRRSPWFVRSGGEGSGLYKSVDGGESWTRLEGGLPELMGKVGVAVSPADPRRVYAIVEAEEGGLYRSEDGGESWKRQNATRVIQARSWYYNHITADPDDPETVWVLNVPLLKSIDGGRTFEAVATPHSDHHSLWIRPGESRIMALGTDGGATVSLDGGESWSPLDNQPTAQMYRVTTDDRFPYWIYGGQQDWSTSAIPSRTPAGSVGSYDARSIGGGESAHVALDPSDPSKIYATSINGTLTEFDFATGLSAPIRPYPQYVFGVDGAEQKYRANWNAPILVSQHDPKVLFYGTQKLLSSRDRGRTWREISGDLTRNDPEKQGTSGGPITNEQAGAELYNTLFAVAESPHRPGVLWTGSDCGLVHLSRDGGVTWSNVTPEGLGEAQINSIEVSPHRPASAFLSVTGYKSNDFTPRILRTENFGASWRLIVDGLPENTFVRAVREDPSRAGLLYAAAETGVFVSFDGGGAWQSLQLDLPEVPVTDLSLRQGDLVAATQGRGFWVLDDLSPLRQLTAEIARAPVHLFAPRPAVRLEGGPGRYAASSSSGPPAGAVLAYRLAEDAEGPLEIEILDTAGRVIRTYSSEEREVDRCRQANLEERSRRPVELPEAGAGQHAWVWDLRREGLPCIPEHRLFRGLAGPRVVPGDFRVRLRVGEEEREQPLRVLADPRLEPAGEADLAFLEDFLDRAVALFGRLTSSVAAARSVRAQVEERLLRASEAEGLGSGALETLEAAAEPLLKDLSAFEDAVVQTRHETFDDDINWPNRLDVQVGFLISEADEAGVPVSAGARQRLADLEAEWLELEAERDRWLGDGLAAFEAALDEAKVTGVVVPPIKPPRAGGQGL
ncbi:MAG: glycosyl hydrolase [Acidobacteriota bacterium]